MAFQLLDEDQEVSIGYKWIKCHLIFDMIAKRRRVFKVEVVGDCYVAVCGLPYPRVDHAVVMCKFALECVKEMNRLTQELEVELGPDTTELCLRAGLHSGPNNTSFTIKCRGSNTPSKTQVNVGPTS